MIQRILVATVAMGCAACGGSGSNIPLVEVPVASDNVGITIEDAVYSERLDTYFVVLSGFIATRLGDSIILPRNPVFDFASFEVAEDGTGNALFIAETESARVNLTLLNDASTGVGYSRLVASGIPESGSAQFDGDYVALVQDSSDDDILLVVNADAMLEIDFGSGAVSGVVSNRVARSIEDNAVLDGVGRDDLVLTAGDLDPDGSFFGDVEGGNLDLSALSGGEVTTTSTGSFSGLVAGPKGEEVVGAASIFHDAGAAGNFFEEGAFIASE